MNGFPSYLQSVERTWEDVASRSCHAAVYAVIDASALPGALLAEVMTRFETNISGLYSGALARNFRAKAPYLASVTRSTARWIEAELRGINWGVLYVCRSDTGSDELRKQLRKHVVVRDPRGERCLFRFYDPRVLPGYLRSCRKAEASAFFGLAREIIVFPASAPSGRGYRFVGERAGRRERGAPLITLRSEQLASMSRNDHKEMANRSCSFLRARGHNVTEGPGGALRVTSTRGADLRVEFQPRTCRATLAAYDPSTGPFSLEFDRDGCPRRVLEYNRATEFVYDAKGRLVLVRHPDDTTNEFGYSRDGLLVSATDRAGATTEFLRRADGVEVGVIDPLGRQIDFVVAEDSSALEAIDYPDGARERFLHDESIRLAATLHRDDSLTVDALDLDGRVVGTIYSDLTTVEIVEARRSKTITSHGIDVERRYDRRGALVEERSGARRYRLERSGSGQLTRTVDPDGGECSYQYAEGRLQAMTTRGRTIEYAYDANGRIDEIRYRDRAGSPVVERRRYDQSNRPTCVSIYSHRSNPAHSYFYGYDACDRLTHVREHDPGEGLDRALSIELDREGRVVSERPSRQGVHHRARRYRYDRKGNLINDGGTAVVFDACDAPLARGGRELEYDRRGRAVTIPGRGGHVRLEYNSDDTVRVAEQLGTSYRVQFRYDPLQRLVEARDGKRVWRFGWCARQMVRERCFVGDSLLVDRVYWYAPTARLAGEVQGYNPIAFFEDGEVVWLQRDVRHAVVRALDGSGRTIWRAEYDSFGQCTTSGEAIHQPWRLAGQYAFPGLGLHYNGARFYSPTIKSYLTRDPLWREPDGAFYSYALNKPWEAIDPFGEIAFVLAIPAWKLAVAGVGLLTAAVLSTPAGQEAIKDTVNAVADAMDNVCINCTQAPAVPRAIPRVRPRRPDDWCRKKGLSPGSPNCQSRRRKIKNIENDIKKRYEELKLDIGKLPGKLPKGFPRRFSRQGHYEIISELKRILSDHQGVVKACCGG